MPSGIYHIAPAIYHISARKYITFPSGKISLGVVKIPFHNALWLGVHCIYRVAIISGVMFSSRAMTISTDFSKS